MKNKKLLFSFIWYCITHKHERFWQALRNWSGYNFIYVSNDIRDCETLTDTFYKDDK